MFTLQLHGLLLELMTPLLSHLELSAEREPWKEDNIWCKERKGKCTWERSSHSAYLSHDHIQQGKKPMVIITQGQDLLVVISWMTEEYNK